MAELQASLLCESGSEDALYNACQSLLMFAIFDPGVSGKYVIFFQFSDPLKNLILNTVTAFQILIF